jgi:hypothetical protein
MSAASDQLSLLFAALSVVDEFDLPSPEISEHEGMLVLDWLPDNWVRLTLALSPVGEVHWAVLIHEFRAHGRTTSLDDPKLQDAMQRLGKADDDLRAKQ